jgi:hypothetical protein
VNARKYEAELDRMACSALRVSEHFRGRGDEARADVALDLAIELIAELSAERTAGALARDFAREINALVAANES